MLAAPNFLRLPANFLRLLARLQHTERGASIYTRAHYMHTKQKRETGITRNPLISLVRLTGFEPVTYGLEVRCSIQLSYRRAVLLIVTRRS